MKRLKIGQISPAGDYWHYILVEGRPLPRTTAIRFLFVGRKAGKRLKTG
ncbi:MAG TPA: hypothetical protein VN944_11010 [Nitrospiria bacterium]|nr:hypothetical protein [Nitrospiria bacterium]